MTRWLLSIMVSATILLARFGLQSYRVGRRQFRQRGIAVPGWLLVAALFIGPVRAGDVPCALEAAMPPDMGNLPDPLIPRAARRRHSVQDSSHRL